MSRAQAAAGARGDPGVRQLGRRRLSVADYRTYVAPHTRRVLGATATGAPVVHFATGSAHLLGRAGRRPAATPSASTGGFRSTRPRRSSRRRRTARDPGQPRSGGHPGGPPADRGGRGRRARARRRSRPGTSSTSATRRRATRIPAALRDLASFVHDRTAGTARRTADHRPRLEFPCMPDLGVLLMTYGSPSSLDDVPRYMTAVRGGRAPEPELVTEFKRRYEVIGGSPLVPVTRGAGGRARGRVRQGRRSSAPGCASRDPTIEERSASWRTTARRQRRRRSCCRRSTRRC